MVVEMRVKGSTNTNSLGSHIDKSLDEGKEVSVFAVGVRAVNQSVKGLSVASRHSRNNGKILLYESFFDKVIDKDSKETVIRMKFDVIRFNAEYFKEIKNTSYNEKFRIILNELKDKLLYSLLDIVKNIHGFNLCERVEKVINYVFKEYEK